MRTDKAALNSLLAIAQRIIDTILSFVYRTIFIYIMGVTYLGVNGLFSNIFTIMSLAELGIGSTIIYLLYEPLSKKNEEEIKSLMQVFSKMYVIIGITIAVVGIILIPFFPYIINNEGVEIPNLNIIYICMLLNSAFGYFFSYKRSLLEADQKGYLSSLNISLFGILNNILKILVLLITHNFILTLLVSLVITLISNIVISRKADKLYPYLKTKNTLKLGKNKIKVIKERMKAVFMHNVSNVILVGTDNIIISKFINIAAVGIYSNYVLITDTLYGIFTMIFTSITSSIGNMKVNDSKEKGESIFYRLLLANFYFYFITCIVLYVCINPFIKLWIGDTYVLSNAITIIIIVKLYISGLKHVPVSFINASGLNYNTRYKAIIEAILNLTISLIAVRYLGIFGVLLGTVISLFLCSVLVEPIVLFKHWFKSPVSKYFYKYFKYALLTIISCIAVDYIMSFVSDTTLIMFLIKAILTFIIANIIFIIIYRRNEDFKFYVNYFINKIKKVLKKR